MNCQSCEKRKLKTNSYICSMISRHLKFILIAWLACGPLLGFAQDSLQIKLMQAIEQNDFKSVKKLVKAGADVNESIVSSSPNYLFFISQHLYLEPLVKGMQGETVYVTPLHASADRANIKVLKYLKKKKANIEAGDSEGKTPLMYALRNPGGEEYALTLLKKGANFRAVDAAGNTALMGVCFKGYENIASLLIQHGANVNKTNSNGATALIFAAMFNRAPLIKLLLENGADTNLKDDKGNTALDHARMQGLKEVVTMLVN